MRAARPLFPKLIPVILIVLFGVIAIPGISWGAPEIWHPDELVRQVSEALHGTYRFDEKNFDYPSLPKYAMYGLGKLVFALGLSQKDFILSARLLSVLLGALVVVLAYVIARRMGAGLWSSLFSAALVLSSSEMAINARFAHNDMYITFFAALSVFALLRYRLSGNRLWLYAAFFSVGLTASSKYNGVSLLLAVLIAFLLDWREHLRQGGLRAIETLSIGGVLSVLGYGLGTPKSLLWLAYYLKRVIPALQHHAIYARQPDSVIGLYGQWGILKQVLGLPVALLFLGAFLWHIIRVASFYAGKFQAERREIEMKVVVLVSVLALDLPILLSYNYQPRFLLPLVPLLAVLSALFIQELASLAGRWSKPWSLRIIAGLAIFIVLITLPRVVSIALLFENDPRIPASRYVESLPRGTSLEYTLYPPTIPEGYFSRRHHYPIFFKKYPDQPEPTSPFYTFNAGEAGLEERQTDYLVVDSFTYARFQDAYICETNPVECRFFQRLLADETNYQLIADFAYQLPWYLPQLKPPFVNPEIRVYARRH